MTHPASTAVSDTVFEAWVASIFDRPTEGLEWYWEEDVTEPEPAPAVELVARLFETAGEWSRAFDDAQVGRGLWYLASSDCSNYALDLLRADLPWPPRRRALAGITTLFHDLFAKRCRPLLGHAEPSGAGPLEGTCYMWWDLFPTWGKPEDPAQREVDEVLLAVMDESLSLDHITCQESALHGLGHWQLHYPRFVEARIDRYLALSDLDPRLRRYAECARRGCVL